MRFLACKTPEGLLPIDANGTAYLSKVKLGATVEIEVKQPRNVKHHRLYWALVSKVWENMDHERYPSPDDLSAAFKIAAGIRTRIELPTGAVGFIPGSIAFHKMDQREFDAFFDRVCDLVCEHFLPGVTERELKHEISLMVGATR